MIILKSENEINAMRHAGTILARVLKAVTEAVRPGITTQELDEIAAEVIRKAGCKPSFLGYNGFPSTLCISVNEEVVHGFPGARKLQEGDIVSIDGGVIYEGMHSDSAVTLPVGEISAEKARLLQVTKESLYLGIAQALEGNRLSDISHAVQVHAEAAGYSVVRDLVGHGVGCDLHEDPEIPNYGSPHRGPRLKSGMTLAIEPMINMGRYEVEVEENQWTIVTQDRQPSAHFEHSILITPTGPLILSVDDEEPVE
ncbi:MAG: type I methionyl aminopeptidase [Negativicutes bacterium]|nr:type I methionyl aminopeptidase [Negativicutes bacterium]